MAKLIVEIDIPGVPYDVLTREAEEKSSDWYSNEDGDKVVVDEAFLERAKCDDSFFAF